MYHAAQRFTATLTRMAAGLSQTGREMEAQKIRNALTLFDDAESFREAMKVAGEVLDNVQKDVEIHAGKPVMVEYARRNIARQQRDGSGLAQPPARQRAGASSDMDLFKKAGVLP
jgi:hypothetical protein